MTVVGVVWIAIMTAICVIGIELSARTQVGLLGAEIVTLAHLRRRRAGQGRGRRRRARRRSTRSLSWLNPFADRQLRAPSSTGVLLAVFIYWGWDSTVTVNEESRGLRRDARPGRGRRDVHPAAIYVIVAFAAQAFAGRRTLIDNADDVLSVLGDRGPRLAAGQAR